MNWEMLQPLLTEMLEDGKVARKEVEKSGMLVSEMSRQLTQLEARFERQTASPPSVDNDDLKIFMQLEFTGLKLEIDQQLKRSTQQKHFVLFSENFNAQNFKVVFETVCKWIGILGGGFYLLFALFERWR